MLPASNQESELMPEVSVNGKVLRWARELRGLTLEDAATLLGIPTEELSAFEAGGKKPMVGVLRTMSSKYRINFTSLLMPEPLPMRKRPADHRARNRRRRLSVDTLVAIEEVSEALEAFRDIASVKRSIVTKPKLGLADIDENPEEVAARERKKFDVSLEVQRSWRYPARARIEWRKRIEQRGIFTYMIGLPLEELSGFSLLQDGFAAICVNDRELTEGAKIFTLFHEYCHLLLRNTGISDENDANRVERFCNDFAASFLIPRTQLDTVVSAILGDIQLPYEFSDAHVKRLARSFLVSNRAMALRLEKTGVAPKDFYRRRTAPWDIPNEPEPVNPKSQPNPITIRIKRLGHLHAGTVLEAVRRHAINSFDASELIGLNPASFPKIEAALG